MIGAVAAAALAIVLAIVFWPDGNGTTTGGNTTTSSTSSTTPDDPPGPTAGEAGLEFAQGSLDFIDAADDPTGPLTTALATLRDATPFDVIEDRACGPDTVDSGLLDDARTLVSTLATEATDPELVRRYQLAVDVYGDLAVRCTGGGSLLTIRGANWHERADQTEAHISAWVDALRDCQGEGPDHVQCLLIEEMVALEVVDVAPPVEFGPQAYSPAIVDGTVWLAMNARNGPGGERSAQLAEIDAATGATTTRELALGGETPLLADGRLWIPTSGGSVTEGLVHVIDATTGEAAPPVEVGANPFIAVGGSERIFVPNRGDGTVTVIDPSDLSTRSIDVFTALTDGEGDDPTATKTRVGGSGSEVWAASSEIAAAVRLDPATGEVTQRFELLGPPHRR